MTAEGRHATQSLPALMEECSAIGRDPLGGVTRLGWSSELLEAIGWVSDQLRELGLTTEVDEAGNLFGKWTAGTGDPLLLGSHLDSVTRGGAFDGALGVVTGLYALRQLRSRGFAPRRPIWLAAWMDEEGGRFGTPLFGSRAFAGEDLGDVHALQDSRGIALRDAMSEWGKNIDELPAAARIDEIGHYLELHIEQGPVLDRAGVDVAVVTTIVGLLGYRIRLTGETNHAGTTPPEDRRDALAGAARITLALRDAMRARPAMRANVGEIAVSPGVFNVIPGAATFSIDVRSSDAEAFTQNDVVVLDTVREIAEQEDLRFEIETTHRIQPTPLDDDLRSVLHEAVKSAGASVMDLPSGAGHDAQVIARHVPTAMLFVPSRRGISHAPEEFTDPDHQEVGAEVLIRAIEAIAG